MAAQNSGQRRIRQWGRARGNVTQVAGDQHVYGHETPPVASASVQWPVRVGDVPSLAAAFQPRTPVRDQARQARGAGKDVVLSGSGGVGKSQLAAFLARELRDQGHAPEDAGPSGLDVLVWVRATGTDQIIAAYAQAAAQLNLTGASPDAEAAAAAQAFLTWSAGTQRRWAVVLDDIADPTTVQDWWPDTGAGRGWVLATTRRDDAWFSGQNRTLVLLGLYTENEARAYLQRRLTDAGHPHLHHPDSADELAQELGHLPLALGHAAAYMINRRSTTTNYLTLLRNADTRLHDLFPADADTEGYGRPLAASLLLTLDAVSTVDPTGLTRPLLHLACLMDPLGHPAQTWTTPAALTHLRTKHPPRRRLLRRRHAPVTEHDVRGALDLLRSYTLITQDTADGPIRMHALTARAARETIPPHTLPATARAAADALTSLWPPHHDHRTAELSAVLRANAIRLDQVTHMALWRPAPHPCIYRVSVSLAEAGFYHQAIDYDEATARRSNALHGPDHPATLAARNNLASAYRNAGRFQDAINLHEDVLVGYERIFGPDHRNTLTTRNNLAGAYRDAGRFQDAFNLHEDVLVGYERIFGPDHRNTLTARNNLAGAYRDAGRFQDAFNLHEDVLAGYERILGPDHPDTLTARTNLAISYRNAGCFQDALKLHEQVLADLERILGPDHPNTLDARNDLAVSYHDAGRVKDALKLHEQVLADLERILGPDHPNTLTTRNNLAVSYRDAGRVKDALDLRERVLADTERILGPEHPDALRARHNLATSYPDSRRFQDAIDLGERVLADTERILGLDHPNTLTVRHNLATSYARTGRFQDAHDLHERVLADRKRTLGPDHPSTLDARKSLTYIRAVMAAAQAAISAAAAEQPIHDRETSANTGSQNGPSRDC